MSEATEQVISGLEGVLVCESSIAYIDGSIPELSFRGYDIHDIAQTLTFWPVGGLFLSRLLTCCALCLPQGIPWRGYAQRCRCSGPWTRALRISTQRTTCAKPKTSRHRCRPSWRRKRACNA